ncbi:aldehyde dehydrogenase family protein [Nitrospirillum iridis]|uniref:Aldehyde dehydrogenase (NAD+) n=1 Tax=Nitrospirillum iridis TaxID=765888 RepID=A0A7X0EHE4_9PROT|nr:aldehyde dehydrogenase family protein [Nitrospirillum iridis]MBB6254549.1 aldehyde dehydrogenase (NAD+) [Nitrospirillum iridis]
MDFTKHYVNGQWVQPIEPRPFRTIDPATEETSGEILLGGAVDVDRAVAAAKSAFPAYSQTTGAERQALMERILEAYNARFGEIAQAITREMGAPVAIARDHQAGIGVGHISAMIEVLEKFAFEEKRASGFLRYEAVGVCALITPWNWPINQVAAKVLPALAAGCTMVLKPSEFSAYSAMVWAQVLDDAGVPAGVFNLVNGSGEDVGSPLASHRDVDMVSFTGSTRAGVKIALASAPTVKRVHQELGGKSPSIILDDADFATSIDATVRVLMLNSGQSCDAPSRLLVPAKRLAEAERVARSTAQSMRLGDVNSEETEMGPVVSAIQYGRIQGYIEKGISEGAELIVGGLGRPAGIKKGFYVQPTVFSKVRNDMTIAREEIFGPVLSIIPYDDEEDAVRIANDTPYGLSAYVWSGDQERARRVACRIRSGQVVVNGGQQDMHTPFGGFKQSGNGREFGVFGLHDYLEVKAVVE